MSVLSGTSSVWRSAARWELIFFLIMLTTGFISIAISQMALGGALFFLLWRWIVRKQPPETTDLEKTAFLLALWALAMVPLSTNVAQSAVYYRRFYLFWALWVGAQLATNEQRRQLLLGFLLAGAVISSLYGEIYHLVNYGGLLNQRMTEVYNPMTGGALLMMAALLATGFLLTSGSGRRMKIAVAVVILPIALGLVMTSTRSALLGVLVGLGCMLLLVKPRLFGVFLGVLVVSLVVIGFFGENFLPDSVWRRLDPEYFLSGNSTSERLDMWRGGIEIVKAHPITGVGDRGLEEIASQYYQSRSNHYFGHLHSNIFHMAAIWGVPGLILGQLFLWSGLWFLFKRWRMLSRLETGTRGLAISRGWVLGAIGVWISFYIAGLTEWYFGDAESMLIFFAILGCALGKDKKTTGSE